MTILEELIKRKVNTADDMALLAQLLEQDGDWPRARERLQGLVTSQKTNPAFLTRYISALLRHDQIADAQLHLARLEQLAPDRPAIFEMKARILVAQKKPAEAVGLLEKFAQGNDARMEPVARLLEELGQWEPAEKLYRALNAKLQARSPEVAHAGRVSQPAGPRQGRDWTSSMALGRAVRPKRSPTRA